jgi:hypothetical protein
MPLIELHKIHDGDDCPIVVNSDHIISIAASDDDLSTVVVTTAGTFDIAERYETLKTLLRV